jgi:hypothetical protein
MAGIAFVTFLVACAVWFAARAYQQHQSEPTDLTRYPLKHRLVGVHMRAAQRKARGALG